MNNVLRDGLIPLSLVTNPAHRFEVRLVDFEDWRLVRADVRGTARSHIESGAPRLVDLLAAASDKSGRPSDYARAWALLMRTDFTQVGMDALQWLAESRKYNAHDIEPLLCRLAVDHPAEVAQLFPHGLTVDVCALCGEHGLRAALRELGSGRAQNRQDSAFVLHDLAADGLLTVPVEPLIDALVVERNENAIDTMRSALLAVRRRSGEQERDRPGAPGDQAMAGDS